MKLGDPSDYVLAHHNVGDNENAGQHSESSWERLHRRCGLIVNDDRFQTSIIILIIINSIIMAVGTFGFVRNDEFLNALFGYIDLGFLIIFTIELIMHIIYYGLGLFNDGWMSFDFFVIVVSWTSNSMQILRAFRIMRIFRLMAKVKSLKDLVQALVGVIPRLFAIGLLLSLTFFVYAVMMTELFADLYEEGYTSRDYFSRLDRTAFTLFQIMTLDSWASGIALEVMARQTWAWIPLVSFVMISSFIVMNLVIAVICDAVSSIQTAELEKHMEEMKQKTPDTSNDKSIQTSDVARLEARIEEMHSILQELRAELQLEREARTRTTMSAFS